MDQSPKVPANVASAVQQRWPERGSAWLGAVETELAELCQRYGAEPRRVFPARYGFVVAVDTNDGGLVLRASADPNAPDQASVATALGRLGIAPAVHDTIATSTGTWMVLDEVRPGTALAEADPSTVTLESLAAPLQAMIGQPAPAPGLPTIAGWLRQRLEDDQLADRAPGTELPTRDERREALKILDDLQHDFVPTLCHGDVSPWNILSSEGGGWRFVDPRGVSGEPEYDIAILSIKVARGQPPSGLAALLAKAVGSSPLRAQTWIPVAEAARV